MKRVVALLAVCGFVGVMACGSSTPSTSGSGDNDQTDNGGPTDTSAPIPGSDVVGQPLDAHTVSLSWGAAADDISPRDKLGYRVVYALAGATIDAVDGAGLTAATPDWQLLDLNTSIIIANLTPNTNYAFAVFVRDEADNVAEYPVVTVATLAEPVVDTTPPYVLSTTPTSGSTLSTSATITIVFSESMKTTSLALTGDLGLISNGGVFSTTTATDDTLTIAPATTWSDGTGLTLIVNATDLAGNSLVTVTDHFDVDTDVPPAPTVVSVTPNDTSVIAGDTPIVIVFDQSMGTTSQMLGGLMSTEGDNASWSTTNLANDTLTIIPAVHWYGGAMTLTVSASNTFATPLATPLSLHYSGPVSPFIADYAIAAGSSPYLGVGPSDVVYLAGDTYANPGDGAYDHWRVTRLDAAGRVQWNKTINEGTNSRPQGMVVTADGGFVLIANLAGAIWVGRFDGDANVTWAYTYDWQASSNERALALAEVFDSGDNENGFIIAGDGDGNGQLLRIDDLGAVLWWQSYNPQPTNGQNSLQWVATLADGGFLTGYTSTTLAASYTPAAWVMRTAADGSVTWSEEFASDGGFDLSEYGVELTDGRIALVTRTINSSDNSCNMQMRVVDGATGTITWETEYVSAGLSPFRMVAIAGSGFAVGGPMLLAGGQPDGVLFERTDDGAGGFDEAFQRRYGSVSGGLGGPMYGVALAANGDFYTLAGDYNELDRVSASGALAGSEITTSYASSATFVLPQTTTTLTTTTTASSGADIVRTTQTVSTTDVGLTVSYKVR